MPAPHDIRVFSDDTMPPIKCHSVAEMDAALDRLHAAALHRELAGSGGPLSVLIAIPGYNIHTGLGSPESFVMLGAAPYDEWYVAVGDEEAQGDKRMFFGVGQDSYWAPKHLIPLGVARDAVRYFVEHQQRSPALMWEC
jgi:hypothetical protein